MSKYRFFRRHPGEGTPMILAIVLVLLMLFCTVAEFSRVWIIAQGVKEAAQQAVISTINDNYDDVYHAVREGYAAGWYPDGTGRWDESVDTGDVYGQLASTLGLENTGSGYQKISNGNVEYTISGLSVSGCAANRSLMCSPTFPASSRTLTTTDLRPAEPPSRISKRCWVFTLSRT